MSNTKIYNEHQLARQLERYYSGETTPEEELMLHLALRALPDESPHKKHLLLFEAMLQLPMEEEKPTRKPLTLFFGKKVRMAVASVAAIVVLGLAIILPLKKTNYDSYINGQPIAQEEVDKHLNEVFATFERGVCEGSQQRAFLEAKLVETDELMERTWERLDRISDENFYVLTNY